MKAKGPIIPLHGRLLIAVVIVVLLAQGALAFPLADVDTSWARESIRRLVESEFIEASPGGMFGPDEEMTRAEFARIAARAFPQSTESVRVFTDAQNHPARKELSQLVDRGALLVGADATIRPDEPITRAEAARALVSLMELDALTSRVAVTDSPLFDDVSGDHPMYGDIQVAAKLGLFPPFVRGRLWPDEHLTRAEAAFMIDSGLRLERHAGRLERVDAERRVLWLGGSSQGLRSFPVSELHVYEPDARLEWTEVEPGRPIQLMTNRFGRPLLAWAEVDAQDESWMDTLRELAVTFLTPEQLRALLDGDWQEATTEAKAVLYNELVARGLRPWEADALLAQDWSSVQELGQARLAEVVGEYLQVSPQLVSAVIARDWTAARDYAQIEALERLLQARLFESSSGS